jgi:8-oxo-dGTP diphosphatase
MSASKKVNLRVTALCIQDEHVLMVKHKRFTYTKDFPEAYWILPGGVLEPGESVPEGIQREVREETGLECNVGNLLFVKELIYPYPSENQTSITHHSVSLAFYCEIVGGTLITGKDPEFADDDQVILKTDWLPIKSLAEYDVYPPFLPGFVQQGYQTKFQNIPVRYFDSFQ